MHFHRTKRSKDICTFGANGRRLAHARKAIAKDRASWALFPEYVKYETPEERIAALDAGKLRDEIEDRQDRARAWRNARRCLNQFPEPLRTRLLRYWNRGAYPGDPCYLMGLLDKALLGSFDPEAKERELERCRTLGALTQEIAQSLDVPQWPWPQFQRRDQFFVHLHVARQIAQARSPQLFPELTYDEPDDVFAGCLSKKNTHTHN